MLKINKYIVERNSPCPCYSGKKFKNCCQDNLNEEFYDRATDLFNQKNYAGSLSAFRAHLSKYTFWLNEHTKYIMDISPQAGQELLLIDINALVSIINSITKCLYNLNLQSEIDSFLIKTKDKIEDIRYKFYIDALRSYWLDITDEKNKAKMVMYQYVDFDVTIIPFTEFSVRFLQTYLQVLITELPLSKYILITDRLLDVTKQKEEKIDLLSTKIFVHFIYNDYKSAKLLIDQIEKEIITYESSDPVKYIYIKIFKANILEIKGFIYHKNEFIEEATHLFKEILKTIDDPIVSDTFNTRIGVLLSHLRKSNEALEYFNKVKNKSLLELNYAYLKCLFDNKKIDEAKSFLSKLSISDFEDDIKLDYYSLFAELAIINKDRSELENIILKIKDLDIDVNIFVELRNKTIDHLYGVLQNINKSTSLLDKVRGFAAKYLLLQPSFFGFGINLNEIVKPKRDDSTNKNY